MMSRMSLAAAVVVSLVGAHAQADLVTLDAMDSGWYRSTGFHNSADTDYRVGADGPLETRNWFVFDLSAVAGNILSAELRLFNPAAGYQSGDPTETYFLFDVSTPISMLTSNNGAGNGASVFTDIGSGDVFGSTPVSAANNESTVTIALNVDALTSLNAAASLWAIGGRLTTLDAPVDLEYVFGGSAEMSRQLVLTTDAIAAVPEPSSLALLSLGGIVLVRTIRRRAAPS